MNEKPTRGERNNNPGNIREMPGDTTLWKGERATDDDSAFEEFETPADGIRALAKVLLAYQKRYGIRTVRGFIMRWAPPNGINGLAENDTEAYIRAVANRMGVGDVEALDLTNRHTMQLLVTAIIHHENGRCIYPETEIISAIARAYA